MTLTRRQQIEALEKDWATNPRWKNVKRTYTAEEVVELRGSMVPANTIAQRGADKLWSLVNGSAKKGYVNCLGALTGGQAVQQAKAGIEAIYLSGWQVAADNNTASTMYQISRYTQWTQCLQWLSASTTLSVVLTKFSGRMASLLKMKVVLITSYQS